nr:MAG TPA: hypothetical protein [Caudoviricetes sp.]
MKLEVIGRIIRILINRLILQISQNGHTLPLKELI